jgi:acyl-CoA thioester hydrolase
MAIDSDGLPDPARVVLRRRIEWMDTDAAGIYHWTTVFRLAEAAEAAMHTALGIADFTFGATPRVSVAATFSRSLRFNEPVEVELAVVALGRTSVEYALRI